MSIPASVNLIRCVYLKVDLYSIERCLGGGVSRRRRMRFECGSEDYFYFFFFILLLCTTRMRCTYASIGGTYIALCVRCLCVKPSWDNAFWTFPIFTSSHAFPLGAGASCVRASC